MSIHWGFNLAVALAALLLAYGGARRSHSFVPYGLTGIGLSGWLGLTSFTELPDWMTVAVILMAITLYLVGIYRQGVHERMWHLAALMVGLGGKAFCAFFPWFIEFMSGNVEIPMWVIFSPIPLVVIATLILFAWPSLMNRFGRRQKTASQPPKPTPPVHPDDPAREENDDEKKT